MSVSEPVTIRERYVQALSSKHLEHRLQRRGAIDMFGAAGAAGMTDQHRPEHLRSGRAPSTIGLLLFRLMAEYDEVRGRQSIARRNQEAAGSREAAREHAADAVAREMRRRQRSGEAELTANELQACVVKSGQDLRDQIAHEAKAAHALALLGLLSLASTKQAFGEWAIGRAVKRRFMDTGPMPLVDPDTSDLVSAWRTAKADQARVTLALAGRVLDLILDPNCYRCEGRGFSGGYNNTPQRICNDLRKGGCGGSGKRPSKVGKTSEENDFAAYLLNEVEIMLERAIRDVKAKLQDAPSASSASAAGTIR